MSYIPGGYGKYTQTTITNTTSIVSGGGYLHSLACTNGSGTITFIVDGVTIYTGNVSSWQYLYWTGWNFYFSSTASWNINTKPWEIPYTAGWSLTVPSGVTMVATYYK